MSFDDPLPEPGDRPAGAAVSDPAGLAAGTVDRRLLAAGAVLVLVTAVAIAIAVGNIRRADDWKAVADGRADRILALEQAISTSETDVDELLALVDDLVETQAQAGDMEALATEPGGSVDLGRLAARAQAEIAACVDGVVDLIDILEGPPGGYDADRAAYAQQVADACQTARAAVLAVHDLAG